MPEYKGDDYYFKFVGKNFEMKVKSKSVYSYDRILSYDPDKKEFEVENYYLTLGSSTKQILKRNYCFVDMDNFVEISEEDYNAMKFIHNEK